MSSRVALQQTPEERELDKKRAELAALESELCQHELDLATLQAEFRAFEGRYLAIVGIRYAELDEIEARIAEAYARLHPRDNQAREKAQRTRTRARESGEAAGTAREQPAPKDFKPPEDLKKLYREAAKRIHPDLTTDPEERARRTRLIADVNLAYQDGDVSRLQTILREWKESPEAVAGEGPGAELIRIIRKIAQVENRLRSIRAELVKLKESDLYQLKTKVEQAEIEGRDLLGEMAATLQEQIAAALRRLDGITRMTART